MLWTYTVAIWILNRIVLCGSWNTTGMLYAPRFISSWRGMDTQNTSTTDVLFEHGFNDIPIKAEVQVRWKGSSLIFPGIKSANVIRVSRNLVRAGVLCMYNRTHVRVMGAPNSSLAESFLIHTGDSSKWTGQNRYNENSKIAEVRVRVWHKKDFPTPDFVKTNNTLKSKQTFQEKHNVSSESIYATVQLIFDDGWIGEAQGKLSDNQQLKTKRRSESNYEPSYIHPNKPHCGGVLFAVTQKYVYVWTPHSNQQDILFTYFGWGSCSNVTECSYYNATVHITFWRSLTQTNVCTGYGRHTGKREIIHESNFSNNVDSDIFEAFADIRQKPNKEVYTLFGSGAAMMDVEEKASGLVYGYSNETNKIMIWHPNSYRVRVESSGDSVGFTGNAAQVRVCVWSGKGHDIYSTTTGPTPSTTETAQATTEAASATTETAQATTKTAPATTETAQATTKTAPATTETAQATTETAQATTKRAQATTETGIVSTETTCTKLKRALLIFGTYLDLSEFGENVLVDLSYLGNKYLLFTCKHGYLPDSGDSNRTFYVENESMSGQALVCKERNPLRTFIEIEERTREIVKNLTVAKNSTSKYRRSLQSALDLRMSSLVLGTLSGIMLGGFIVLIVMSDMDTILVPVIDIIEPPRDKTNIVDSA